MKHKRKAMKIRYCPHCVELVHFEADEPVQLCWNCHTVSNFDSVETEDQRLRACLSHYLSAAMHWVFWPIEVAIQWAFGWTFRARGFARLCLVGAVPAVVTMLLISNSFDIHVVHDLSASFTQVPLDPFNLDFPPF